jgi:hypothetical protein
VVEAGAEERSGANGGSHAVGGSVLTVKSSISNRPQSRLMADLSKLLFFSPWGKHVQSFVFTIYSFSINLHGDINFGAFLEPHLLTIFGGE